jgi:hypothetical protein
LLANDLPCPACQGRGVTAVSIRKAAATARDGGGDIGQQGPAKKHADTRFATITLAEFAETLTPAEKTFYDEITIRQDDAVNGKPRMISSAEKNINSQSTGPSQANEWQLNHRVRRKLERFLTG